uniref:Uncharacterized protein n=1 Tax=Glycine max TaxID=3847 RepID=C6TN52_SOYBN|nr:unknown [Glycine max]
MAADEDMSALKSKLSQSNETWKKEMERSQSQVDVLQARIMEVKAQIQGSEEDAKKELEVLWRRRKKMLLSRLLSRRVTMFSFHEICVKFCFETLVIKRSSVLIV